MLPQFQCYKLYLLVFRRFMKFKSFFNSIQSLKEIINIGLTFKLRYVHLRIEVVVTIIITIYNFISSQVHWMWWSTMIGIFTFCSLMVAVYFLPKLIIMFHDIQTRSIVLKILFQTLHLKSQSLHNIYECIFTTTMIGRSFFQLPSYSRALP